jgi:dipeptidyl aminopeptidase/acylaminoacyl peptidase
MHYDMNRSTPFRQETKRQSVTPAIAKLLLLALALLLTGCAAAPLTPFPTAVPLAISTTPRPAPTQPAPTLVTEALPTQAPTASPTATRISTPSTVDNLLARRTVETLLDHLERGDVDSIVNLYLSDGALQAGMDRVFLDLSTPGRRLQEAKLLELRRTTTASYKARVLLHWAETRLGETSSQPMTLDLVYRQGLWLVERVSLGDTRTGEAESEQQRQVSPSRTPGSAAPLAGRLVFQVSSGGPIYLIDADGANLQRLTDGLDPAWSPSGDRVAFTRWRYPEGIYLIGPDGGGEKRLADGDRLKEVTWSPDGAKLACTEDQGTSEPIEICIPGFCFTIPGTAMAQIWTVDLESGRFSNLPLDGPLAHTPTWSPTGERIVYTDGRGLAWIDLDSLETGRFLDSTAWDTSPTFSPDGRRLAFLSRIHDHWEILVMHADGSGRRQLTHSAPHEGAPTSSVAPAWSPDGRSIAFLSNRDGPWRIYVMAADGSGQRPMFGALLDDLDLRYEWAAEKVISWTK